MALLVAAAVVFLAGDAYGDVTDTPLLMDLVANSTQALAAQVAQLEEVATVAKQALEAAQLAKHVANTVEGLRGTDLHAMGPAFLEGVASANPTLTSVYYGALALPNDTSLIDYSIGNCVADGLNSAPVVDPVTGQIVTDPATGTTALRGQWCRTYLQGGDASMARDLAGAVAGVGKPGAPDAAALLYQQRAQQAYQESVLEYRVCQQQQVLACAQQVCLLGPDGWSQAAPRAGCAVPRAPGAPPPAPATTDAGPCANPWSAVPLSSDLATRAQQITQTCDLARGTVAMVSANVSALEVQAGAERRKLDLLAAQSADVAAATGAVVAQQQLSAEAGAGTNALAAALLAPVPAAAFATPATTGDQQHSICDGGGCP